VCPDIYFSETLLSKLYLSALSITNKYYIIIPQITKAWDATWDGITNKYFIDVPYKTYEEVECFRVDRVNIKSKFSLAEVSLENYKWAGWFDLYSKELYEKLVPIPSDWYGYGQYDLYSMMVLGGLTVSLPNFDFKEYMILGETICEYRLGKTKDKIIRLYIEPYIKQLVRKNINHATERREFIDSHLGEFVEAGINHAMGVLYEREKDRQN
jgi:hypothetical protein